MKDQQELLTSHAAGFGGSDASMVLAIAERLKNGLQLTNTQKHRLRVIKGLELPTSSPETENTLAGHAFEDEVAATIPEGWEREYKIIGNGYDNFVTFAHADFFNVETDSVKECKWSRKYDKEGLKREYAAQLQWYYTVCKVAAVSLCYDTANGKGVVDIERNAPLGAAILDALETIDEAFPNIDLTIREKGVNELPPTVAALLKDIETMTKLLAQDEEMLKAKKAELMAYMDGNNLNKVWSGTASVSYTAPSSSLGFDAKKFEKDHADLFASYRTKIVQKAGYLTVKINKTKE